MDVLVDLGNSRLKWGIAQGNTIRCGEPLAHGAAAFGQHLLGAWRDLGQNPRRLALSSVAAPALAERICQIARQLWPDLEIVTARAQAWAFGVRSGYQAPEKLGVDRWLYLLAARHYHTLPACIADFGTAVTVDLLDAQGTHQGGVIAPGLHMMKRALQHGTQDLFYSARQYPPGLATETGAAIHSGALYACIGLVERIMREQPPETHLLLTGGDSGLVAPHLSFPVHVQADLVLQGLTVILKETL